MSELQNCKLVFSTGINLYIKVLGYQQKKTFDSNKKRFDYPAE